MPARPRPGWVRAFFLAVCMLAALGLAASASAEPRFALREGLACSACHVNRTGGGMRTPFGVAWAQTHCPRGARPAASH